MMVAGLEPPERRRPNAAGPPGGKAAPTSFAELTAAIHVIKRQRRRLRYQRDKAQPGLSKDSVTRPRKASRRCSSCVVAERSVPMPERLLRVMYAPAEGPTDHDLRLAARAERPTRTSARAHEIRMAVPMSLERFEVDEDHAIGEPTEALDFGPWGIDPKTVERLSLAEPTAETASFAPRVRPTPASAGMPWRRCRCSERDCPREVDCRLSACGGIRPGLSPTDASLAEAAEALAEHPIATLSLAYCRGLTAFGCVLSESLTDLDMTGCGQFGDSEAALIAEAAPDLERLALNDWTDLTNDGVETLVRACPGITALELCRCDRLEDEAVRVILDGLEQLADLQLAGLKRVVGHCFADVSDLEKSGSVDGYAEGPVALVKVRPSLSRLDLAECTALSAPVARWLSTSLPALTELRVSGVSEMTDLGLYSLAVAPRIQLRVLDVAGCPNLCADGGTAFACLIDKQQSNLRCLDARKVPKLVAGVVARILETLDLETLRLDHVAAVDDDGFGGADRLTRALQEAEDMLQATVLTENSAASLPPSVRAALFENADGGLNEANSPERTKRQDSFRRPSLRRLSSQDLRRFSSQGGRRRSSHFMHQLAVLRALETLTLAECPRLNDAALTWIACNAPRLRVLDVSHAGAGAAVTDASMCALAHKCPWLEVLLVPRPEKQQGASHRVVSSAYLTDLALVHLAALHRLEQLDLGNHGYLTGRALLDVPRTWLLLRSLTISGCDAVDDVGLSAFLDAAPALSHLEAADCSQLEPDHFQHAVVGRRYAKATTSGFSPVDGAAALEARDAVFARFWEEDAAKMVVVCCFRRMKLQMRLGVRAAAKVVTRAIREYRRCRCDHFRQHFKRLVDFRRFTARHAARRIQRAWKRHRAERRHRAALCIQTLYNKSRGRWVQTMLELLHGAATIMAAAWRGRRARIHHSIRHMRTERKWRKEVGGSIDPIADAVNDIRSRRSLEDVKRRLEGLKREFPSSSSKEDDQRAPKTRKTPNEAGRDFSLPISRKRQIPVFGDAEPPKVQKSAITNNAVHVFGSALWPRSESPEARLPTSDFDPSSETYERKAREFDRMGTDAVLVDSGYISPLPWRDAPNHPASSLLPTLAAAKTALAKQEYLVDRATAIVERKRLEEERRLELALEKQAEEDELRAKAAARETAERHQAASTLSAGARGMSSRKSTEAKKKKAVDERAGLEATRSDRAARTLQRHARGRSVRNYVEGHNIPVTGDDGNENGNEPRAPRRRSSDFASNDDDDEAAREERRRRIQEAVAERDRRKQEYRQILASRVETDFSLRRQFERRMAIHRRKCLREKCEESFETVLAACRERLEPLDAASLDLKDMAAANEAAGMAMQEELRLIDAAVAGYKVRLEKVEAEPGRRNYLDVALRGVAARRAHFKYALEAVETCRWWGTEAMRCHYRRHRARRVLSEDASDRLAWLAQEAQRVLKLREFVSNRRSTAPDTIENRYYVTWLEDQQRRLVSQSIAFDSEQEHLLNRDAAQMSTLLDTSALDSGLTDQLMESFLNDATYSAEKVGLELARARLDSKSDEALRTLKAATELKEKQETLHKSVQVQLRARLEDLHAKETKRLETFVAFQGDEQGLERAKIPNISAVLSVVPKPKKLFDPDKWLDVYRSQPWIAQQEVEEHKRRESREMKRMQEATMKGMSEQKRKELEEEAEQLEALKQEFAEKEAILNDLSTTKEEKNKAEAWLQANRPRLDRLLEDYERRAENLRKLEIQTADFSAALDQEEAEAIERFEKVKAAKAEFERREGEEEAHASRENEARKREIEAELADLDLRLGDPTLSKEERFELETRKLDLLAETAMLDKDQVKMKERKKRRQFLAEKVKAEAKAEEELKKKKELQAKLRAEKKEEAALRDAVKRQLKEAALKEEAEKKRIQVEIETAQKANDVLYTMGLEDPTEKKKKPLKEALKDKVKNTITGAESKQAAAQEKTQMLQSLMRRQRLKLGSVTAIRSIQFTATKEETEEFGDAQEVFASQNLPHYVRLKKTIGTQGIVVWYEETADQDEFISEVQVGAHDMHRAEEKKKNGWIRYSHDAFHPKTLTDPGFAIWARKQASAIYVISSIQVSYSIRDEEILIHDGYSKIDVSLEAFGLGDVYLWVKKVNRNVKPKFESEETILAEMKQVRRELKARPGDASVLERHEKLTVRLEKIKQDQAYRDTYKDDALKYAIEFLGMTQSELEKWMHHFEKIDVDKTGYVTPEQILVYARVKRDTQFIRSMFALLSQPDAQGRLDFGEFVKCLGSFCLFAQREVLHFTFNIFDADNSGTITHDEFVTLLSDLHPDKTQRGSATRALKEIHLEKNGTFNIDQFAEVADKFPVLLHPAFFIQHTIRQRFFGTKFWDEKLRRYMDRNAQLKAERAINTDTILAAERAVVHRRKRRDELIEAKRAAAQKTKSLVKRALLTAQLHSLEFAKSQDTKPIKYGISSRTATKTASSSSS